MDVRVPLFVRDGMDETVQAIWDAQTVVLACHVNPDGDALGSLLGLGLGLEKLGKTVTLLSADGVPVPYRFLPEWGRIATEAPKTESAFDLAIGLDAGEFARLGASTVALSQAKTLIDIDHHVTGKEFGQIKLIDAQTASTAELVFDVLNALGIELTREIAQCLLCGVLTDTGGFRFTNVQPRTMLVGAALIAAGASPTEVYESVYENKTLAAQKLLGRALASLSVTEDKKIAWAAVTQKDFLETHATDNDSDGIANAVRIVRGVEVAIFLRESDNGSFRVSLRAQPGWDVASVAAKFGGGGHKLAAGCTVAGPLDAAVSALLSHLSACD
jgi:bifunctional oligoribonuclease and PAP phosphatase NrnA